MKFVFVYPGPIQDKKTMKMDPLIHYGLALLSSVLKQRGINVDYIDFPAEGLNADSFKKRILLARPDFVGIFATTFQIKDAGLLAAIVKQIGRKILTVVGGAHPSALPVGTLKEFPEFDFVVYGEGIETLPQLLSSFNNSESLQNIKGIVFRDSDKIRVNPPREFLEDLDKLPFPAFELLNLNCYATYAYYAGNVLELPVFIGLGCPYPCKFCFRMSGRKVRYRSPERALEEIEFDHKQFNCSQFTFFDDTFGIDKNRYSSFLELLIDKGYNKKISWVCQTRVDIVDEEFLKLMKRAGCQMIYYGVESGSDEVLEKICKKITTNEIIKTFELTKKYSIKAAASFMIGLPFDTQKTVGETQNFIFKLKPDLLDISIFQPFPGTEFYESTVRGLYNVMLRSFNWSLFEKFSGRNLFYKEFRDGEIDRIKWKIYLKFYFSPTRLLKGEFTKGMYNFLIAYLLNIFYWKIYIKIKYLLKVNKR